MGDSKVMVKLENDFLLWLAASQIDKPFEMQVVLEEGSPSELELYDHFAHNRTNVPLKINVFSFVVLEFLEREIVDEGVSYTLSVARRARPGEKIWAN
jgi:hypothetical protein